MKEMLSIISQYGVTEGLLIVLTGVVIKFNVDSRKEQKKERDKAQEREEYLVEQSRKQMEVTLEKADQREQKLMEHINQSDRCLEQVSESIKGINIAVNYMKKDIEDIKRSC